MKRLFVWLASVSMCTAQAVSIGPFATEGWVDERLQVLTNDLATVQYVDDLVSEVEDKIPDVSVYATKSYVNAVSNAIPDVSGFATKAYVDAVSNAIPDTSVFSTIEYVNTTSNNLALLMDDLVSEDELGSSVSNIVPAWALVPVPPVTAEVDPAFTNWLATTNVVIDENVGTFVSNVVPSWALVPIPPVVAEADPIFTAWEGSNLYVRTTHSGPVVLKNTLVVGTAEVDQNVETAVAEGTSKAYANNSHAEGRETRTASNAIFSHVEGQESKTGGQYSHAAGYRALTAEGGGSRGADAVNPHDYAWAWNGDYTIGDQAWYSSHGSGTFNVNPKGGLDGFYIGTNKLSDLLSGDGGGGSQSDSIVASNGNMATIGTDGNLTITTDVGGVPEIKTVATVDQIPDMSDYRTALAQDAIDSGKASTADATLTPAYSDTPTYSEWVCEPDTVIHDYAGEVSNLVVRHSSSYWSLEGIRTDEGGLFSITVLPYYPSATNLVFSDPTYLATNVVATRTRTDTGYHLGSQSNKLLVSKAYVDTRQWDWSTQVTNAPAFVKKSGDTMTGGLTVPNITVGSRVDGSAVGSSSVAEGNWNTASGRYSHAEGNLATASGEHSHAEGSRTTASGAQSHAEGARTTASGAQSHAEGGLTTASGVLSHAEGQETTASGFTSHAEGFYTLAQNDSEHAQGQYNVSHTGSTDAEKTLHSIGVGTGNNARTNAVEVMRDGKVFVKGVGGYDGTNPTTATNLATYLQNAGGGPIIETDPKWTQFKQDAGINLHTNGQGRYVSATVGLNVSDVGTGRAIQSSLAVGSSDVSSFMSLGAGQGIISNATFGVGLGECYRVTNSASFVWTGAGYDEGFDYSYGSHGDGTFNVDPVGGTAGFYVGNTSLSTHLDNSTKLALDSIAPTFSDSNVYTNGDFVLYNMHLYECTNYTGQAGWRVNDWQQTTVTEILGNLRSILDAINGEAL